MKYEDNLTIHAPLVPPTGYISTSIELYINNLKSANESEVTLYIFIIKQINTKQFY